MYIRLLVWWCLPMTIGACARNDDFVRRIIFFTYNSFPNLIKLLANIASSLHSIVILIKMKEKGIHVVAMKQKGKFSIGCIGMVYAIKNQNAKETEVKSFLSSSMHKWLINKNLL